jgi:hypothetical protein
MLGVALALLAVATGFNSQLTGVEVDVLCGLQVAAFDQCLA